MTGDLDYGCLNDLVGHLLRHAFLRGHQAFARAFADEEITPLQFMVLELVDRNPGIGHQEVARAMSCSPSVLTTALKPVVGAGVLCQSRAVGDRRKVGYTLSAAGKARFARLRQRIGGAEAILLDGLSERERDELRRVLRHIIGRPGGGGDSKT